MRYPLPFFVIAGLATSVVFLSPPGRAQDSKPAATNAPARRAERPPPIVSPELLANGGVTFRYKAPKATEVKASGQFGADAPMSKDADGLWSVTVPSVPAGVHEYRFVVDGLSVIDPQNSALN